MHCISLPSFAAWDSIPSSPLAQIDLSVLNVLNNQPTNQPINQSIDAVNILL